MKKKKNTVIHILSWCLLFSLPIMLLTVKVKTNTVSSLADTKKLSTSFFPVVNESPASSETSSESEEEDTKTVVKEVKKEATSAVKPVVTEVKSEEEYENMKEQMAEDVTVPPKEVTPEVTAPDALETFSGNMSGYGPYQDDDGSWHLFRTATGWDLRNSIYYQDAKYGSLRIVASDTSIKKYSVVRCTLSNGTIINAIVLDRGDKNIGRGKKFEFDLAYKSATEAWQNGVLKNVKFEILRDGK